MRIKYSYILPEENIIWLNQKIIEDKTEGSFSVICKIKNRRTGKIRERKCVYSTFKETERKLRVWNKIMGDAINGAK